MGPKQVEFAFASDVGVIARRGLMDLSDDLADLLADLYADGLLDTLLEGDE